MGEILLLKVCFSPLMIILDKFFFSQINQRSFLIRLNSDYIKILGFFIKELYITLSIKLSIVS